MALIQSDITMGPSDDIVIVLRPETDFDTEETASWLNSLLHRLHTECVRENYLEESLLSAVTHVLFISR